MYLSNAAQAHHAPADLVLSVFQQARSPFVHPYISTANPKAASAPVLTLPSSPDAPANDELVHPHIPEDPIVPILLERARVSLEACESYETRVDLFAEAAERGNAEALYKWALLVKQGAEVANTACGVDSSGEGSGSSEGSASSTAGSVAAGLWNSLGGKKISTVSAFDQDRATMAMLFAADQGHAPALVSLAFALLNGVGAEPLFKSEQMYSTDWNIPVHPAFTVMVPHGGSRVYRQSLLRAAIGRYLRFDPFTCRGASARTANTTFDLSNPRQSDIFGSVLLANTSYDSTSKLQDKQDVDKCPSPTDLALGMFQLAAVHRVAEAEHALAHRSDIIYNFINKLLFNSIGWFFYYRYKHGLGVNVDDETAAAYLRHPASLTAQEFHRVGAQAIVESDRIDDTTAPQVRRRIIFRVLIIWRCFFNNANYNRLRKVTRAMTMSSFSTKKCAPER